MKIRKRLYGRKTFIGSIMLALAGFIFPWRIFHQLVGDIAVGMALAGIAFVAYGLHNRISYIFYQQGEDGKPDLKRSRKAFMR